MAEKKQCLVCNKWFDPCYTCEKLGLTSWKNTTCCREHGILNYIIADYIRKLETKEVCKNKLQEYFDEFGMVEFNNNVKNVVEDIMKEDKPILKKKFK